MTRRQVIPIWRGVRFIKLTDVNANQDATSWRLNQKYVTKTKKKNKKNFGFMA